MPPRAVPRWAFAPLLVGGVLLVALALFDGDRRLAQALFFDPALGAWIGRESFWMEEVLHTGGRNVVRLVAFAALLGWFATFCVDVWARRRRDWGYLAACFALVPLMVGGLKTITNVDCPWDLVGFGGDRPYVDWFADRPDGLPAAACFPGAHSSSAFALFALFFLWSRQHPMRARAALGATLLLGVLFSVAQQSRGAHFLSHDVASAMIAWAMCAGLYAAIFRRGSDR